MKLTFKLVSLLVFGTILVLGVETWFSIRDAVQTFQEDLRRDASQRARSLAGLIQDVGAPSGEQRALALIDEANADGPSGVRWVWLDAGPGDPRRPKASPEQIVQIRQGREVVFQERDSSGHGFLYTYFSPKVPTPRPGALELGYSLDGADRFRHNAILGAAWSARSCWSGAAWLSQLSGLRSWEIPWRS